MQQQKQHKTPTFGVPARPRAMAHTRVDFPDPFGPTTTFSRGPKTAITSLYTRKFFMRRLTTAPFENCEADCLGGGGAPEPVISSMLLLLLTLVVTMVTIRCCLPTLDCLRPIPMLEQALLSSPPRVQHPKFELQIGRERRG